MKTEYVVIGYSKGDKRKAKIIEIERGCDVVGEILYAIQDVTTYGVICNGAAYGVICDSKLEADMTASRWNNQYKELGVYGGDDDDS